MVNKKYFKNLLLSAVFIASSVLVLLCFNVSTVSAIEYEALGGRPAYPDPNISKSENWFIYNLSPGESKEDGVEVMNLYNESWEALVYAADTTKSSSGGFALKQFSEPKNDIGAWVRFYPDNPPEFFKTVFEKKEKKILDFCAMSREDMEKEKQAGQKNKITISNEEFSGLEKWCQGVESIQKKLETKERIIIPFIIRIPAEVDVGEHTGGVLIQKVNPDVQDQGNGSAIKLVTRVGVRIYETVPGEVVKKLTILDFKIVKNFKEFDFSNWFSKDKKAQEYSVQSTVKNEGNVSIDHENVVHVKDFLFKKRNEDISRKFQALKNDQFVSNYSWNNPRFGRFSFATEIKYQDASGTEVVLQSPEIKVWVMPWKEMAVAGVILLLIFAGYMGWRFFQKKKYGGAGWVSYEVLPGDDINKLSEKFSVNWKVLAKTNKLKPPFLLEVGKSILVPPTSESLLSAIQTGGAEESVGEGKKVEGEVESQENTAGITKDSNVEGDKVKDYFTGASIQPEETDDEIIEGGEEDSKPKWIQKLIPSKKTVLVIVLVAVFAALISIIIWLANENRKCEKGVSAQLPAISVGGEESGEKAVLEKVEPEKKEEVTAQENNILPAQVSVKVINGGAAPGTAGKIKDLLVGKGYEKAETANAEERDKIGTTIFYQDDKLKEEAEKIAELLKGNDLRATAKTASSNEEKSAEIVVMLGK